jgi:hypothetical protein
MRDSDVALGPGETSMGRSAENIRKRKLEHAAIRASIADHRANLSKEAVAEEAAYRVQVQPDTPRMRLVRRESGTPGHCRLPVSVRGVAWASDADLGPFPDRVRSCATSAMLASLPRRTSSGGRATPTTESLAVAAKARSSVPAMVSLTRPEPARQSWAAPAGVTSPMSRLPGPHGPVSAGLALPAEGRRAKEVAARTVEIDRLLEVLPHAATVTMSGGKTDPSSIADAELALRANAETFAGAGGAGAAEARRVLKAYLEHRRSTSKPPAEDFPISRAACSLFLKACTDKSRAGDLAGVRKRALQALSRANVRFGVPLDGDIDLGELKVRGKRRKKAAVTAPDLPLRVVAFAELAARRGMGECLRPVEAALRHFDRSVCFLNCLGSRLGNFENLRELKLQKIAGEECVVGITDLKDGSIGCWAAFPLVGIAADMQVWAGEHVRDVNARGVFPAHKKGCFDEGAMPLPQVRKLLVGLAVRAGYGAAMATALAKGHGPRHIGPCFGKRLMWSTEARAEFGMWNEGHEELYWCSIANRIQKRVRETGFLAAERYAQPAKQQVQMRVFADMRRAIVSLIDCTSPESMPWQNEYLIEDSCYVDSMYYKKH